MCLEPVPGSGSKRGPVQSRCKSGAPDLKTQYNKYTKNRLKPRLVEVLREEAADQKTQGWQSFQPTHTHTRRISRWANGAGPASSVINKPAEGSGTHTHSGSVVRTVVKSHRSKGADTFDQLWQRRRLGGLREQHILTSTSDVVSLLQEYRSKKDGDSAPLLALIL